MVSKDDWRRMGQEQGLMGIELQFVERYVPYSEEWEHEHCEFCGTKISQYDGDLHEGYCSTDEKKSHWICKTCFNDFKEEFKWMMK